MKGNLLFLSRKKSGPETMRALKIVFFISDLPRSQNAKQILSSQLIRPL
jgi:hypothetical protein